MKKFFTLYLALLVSFAIISQPSASSNDNIANSTTDPSPSYLQVDDNGFQFEAFTAGTNTEFSDYGICFFKEKFISFSSRKIGAISKKDPNTMEPYTKLYCSDIMEDWDLDRPLLFSRILNKNESLGSLTFSKDGNTMYFTKGVDGDSKRMILYRAVMNPERLGEWINIEPVPLNTGDSSTETPHLSDDGKTLYFSSNRSGGMGGFDIYMAEVRQDGTFGEIMPVSGDINSEGDEKFPHFSVSGKFLYFSSTGHGAIGGYDVFKSRRTDEGFKLVINLGSTINTQYDEIAFVPATDVDAYVTSNRDHEEYGNYNIYKITEFIKLKQSVTGQVIDAKSNQAISDAFVSLIDTDGVEVGTVNTDGEGKFRFPVTSFEYYTLIAKKDGFEQAITIFNTDNKTEEYSMDIGLRSEVMELEAGNEPISLEVDNIQFDSNSDKIQEVSYAALNSVVETLLDHPQVKLALYAHTDSRGDAGYNMDLSQRRADAAKEYLVEKGIDESRLVAKGYGETKPLFDCQNCSEEQHEANRRIEFVIIDTSSF